MFRSVLIAFVTAVTLSFFSLAQAAQKVTSVKGTFNTSQENACIHVSTFFYLTDCFYSRVNEEIIGQKLPWTGPTVNPVYYPVDSEHAVPTYVPVRGDDRFAPPMKGTLTINDQGTRDIADDTLQGTLIVGPAVRSVVVNVNELAGGPGGAPPRAVMTWDNITHTLAETAFDRATKNDHGGYDYVIASKGFPRRLCLVDDPTDCYPSAYAGFTTDGQNARGTWDGPSEYGVTRDTEMEGNVGAQTTAVINGYRCFDNRGDITCPNHNVVWSASIEPAQGDTNINEGPGFDNLLLKISTDDQANILSVKGFWTNEYLIKGGPGFFQVADGHNNSYQGGFLQLTNN
jgi:hypothetical protein